MISASSAQWEQHVTTAMRSFARRYSAVYAKSKREISAHFEIGCLLALVSFYESTGFRGRVMNPASDGSYRYLTTPNGNPNNFSYMSLSGGPETFEIRQQVRIDSHVGSDVAFTPDIVVIPAGAGINSKKDPDYARGRRRLFYVESKDVIAAHECKSLVPFPELLVSFIGMLVAGHEWLERIPKEKILSSQGAHLAPCLFVGGSPRALHLRMVRGLKEAYPMNIVVGMHAGTWDLLGDHADVRRMHNPVKSDLKESNNSFQLTPSPSARGG